MVAKKKIATELSLIRYKAKIAEYMLRDKVHLESKLQQLNEQFKAWVAGFKRYVTVRRIISTVISNVPPSARAPYYAYGQQYFSEVIERGLDRDIVIRQIKSKAGIGTPYPVVKEEILDRVFEAIDKAYGRA